MPLCLVIFVTKKIALSQLTNSIPPVIAYKGFKIATDVKEVLQPQTHDFIDYKNGEQLRPDNSFSPLAIGASISNNTSNQVSSGYGTRTLLVKKNDKHYLLSCFHVLLYNTVNTTNDLIYNKLSGEEAVFPSPLINITFPNNNRFTHPIVEGEFSGFYDYGLVELQSPFEVQNNFDNTIITEFVERENVELYANTQVTANGATSYKQTGKITSIKAEIDLKCRGVIRRYFNVIVTDKLSMPGDSGAPVVTNDNKLLGYIVGGNGENTSFIIPFYNLFLNKDITI